MDNLNEIVFERVTEGDVEDLTFIMKRAFDEDSRRHLDKETGGPPGYDNGDFIRQWYLHSNSEAYKVLKDGILIGGINIFLTPDNQNFLGNIFVDPSCQDKGIGTAIWKQMEQKYPDTKTWRTETPGFSKRNHNFYVNKCGFKVVKIDNPKDKNEECYLLEKEMQKGHGR